MAKTKGKSLRLLKALRSLETHELENIFNYKNLRLQIPKAHDSQEKLINFLAFNFTDKLNYLI
ncbi:MAG: hypothetical protein M0R03_22480 [Novosphingobium sp.]|jgi:hypothetical protein|nr:hypothetical protein [Novosphingobium sp.]